MTAVAAKFLQGRLESLYTASSMMQTRADPLYHFTLATFAGASSKRRLVLLAHDHLLVLVFKAPNLTLTLSHSNKVHVVDHIRVFVGKGHQKSH